MLKSVIVDVTVGVRQGAPSSCLISIIYIDKLVRMLKKKTLGKGGFLGRLHTVTITDDAVVLATSRKICLRKFQVECNIGSESGMAISRKKTVFAKSMDNRAAMFIK